MGHLDNMIKWCLKKGGEGERHRGLRQIRPSVALARKHLAKAEHYLSAAIDLQEKYSDIAVSQAFYAMYHCFLSVLSKHGYESRNQQCTFAMVEALIKKGEVGLDPEAVRRVASFDEPKGKDVIALREEFQYGVETKINMEKLAKIINESKELIQTTKELLV